jgi:hypothetical protein
MGVISFYIFTDGLRKHAAYKAENLMMLQSVSRDFLCDDGSFFSIKSVTQNKSLVNYFSISVINHSDILYDPSFGFIVDGYYKSYIKQGVLQKNDRKKLTTCKNTQGKTFLEVYPESV